MDTPLLAHRSHTAATNLPDLDLLCCATCRPSPSLDPIRSLHHTPPVPIRASVGEV